MMQDELCLCPFCGAGETIIDEKYMPPTMSGKRTIISATVRHWCPREDGQPHGLSISIIRRDRKDAIDAWNKRIPSPGVDEWAIVMRDPERADRDFNALEGYRGGYKDAVWNILTYIQANIGRHKE